MARIDGYLRSIEKFGAAGAILASGEAVTLRFAGGDRQATQVTPHDQLVAMVREVASIEALAMLDTGRPTAFEFVSAGIAYGAQVSPKAGAWTVVLVPAAGTSPAAATGTGSVLAAPRAATPAPVAIDAADGMEIERSQYDDSPESTTSGSTLLDELFAAARAARASDLYLAADAVPMLRVAGELVPMRDRGILDADRLERELGILAPAEQRDGAVAGMPSAFVYGNREVRMRISLARDKRGATAAIRLMVLEPPLPERIGLPDLAVRTVEATRGLFVITGGPGSGKTTSLAALVHAQNVNASRFIVDLAQTIEMVHVSRRGIVSQRCVGEHVGSYAIGVATALRECADVIAIGDCGDGETARAIVTAVQSGALVLVVVAGNDVATALLRIAQLADADEPQRALRTLASNFIGGTAQVMCRRADGNGRFAAFEVVQGSDGVRTALATLDGHGAALASAIEAGKTAGMVSLVDALLDAARRGIK
ncbi:MAG: Flp pilus assembly complex ATPase component TadA [Kofleriaceae bacterium]|nr:Flp pilus assembly complex ATPase component TadA [Kofleriaceae bacterium]